MKMKRLENGYFIIKSRRYVLCGRKHGDTAYVRMKDEWQGIVYVVDGINWEDILRLVDDKITEGEFLDVIYDIK